MNTYHIEVWTKAVNDAEAAVMRLTATLTGGKRENETVEQYAARSRAQQDIALRNLADARAQLAKANEI